MNKAYLLRIAEKDLEDLRKVSFLHEKTVSDFIRCSVRKMIKDLAQVESDAGAVARACIENKNFLKSCR